MSKKTYRKFNFWESPTESNAIERVAPSFFKAINTEINNEILKTEQEKTDDVLLLPKEKLIEKQKTVFYKTPHIDGKKEEINLISEKTATYTKLPGDDIEYNQKDLVQDVFDANGGQWKVLLYFAEKCLETGTLSTGYIKLPHLAKKTNLNEKTVYTAIYRLEKQKKLIIRQKGKEGAGGKSRFMLVSDKIKNYILSHRDGGLNESKHLKIDHDLNNLSEQGGWKEIDISPLKEIGFSEKHLLQLKKYNTPQIVQESINQFSFGFNHNNQIKKYANPLLVFMGVLRKGEAWIEKNYMSPSEIALNQLTEQKKNRIDKIKKTEEECMFTEYTLWEASLTEQYKDTLLPEDVKKTKLSSAKAAVLRLHFKENIWPSKMPTELVNLKKELEFDYKNINKLAIE